MIKEFQGQTESVVLFLSHLGCMLCDYVTTQIKPELQQHFSLFWFLYVHSIHDDLKIHPPLTTRDLHVKHSTYDKMNAILPHRVTLAVK